MSARQAESNSSRTIGIPMLKSEQVMPLISLTTKPGSCHTCQLPGREASMGCSAPGQEKALPWPRVSLLSTHFSGFMPFS